MRVFNIVRAAVLAAATSHTLVRDTRNELGLGPVEDVAE